MRNSDLKNQQLFSYLSATNMAYIDNLYEDYLASANTVPLEWRKVFDALPQVSPTSHDTSHRAIRDHFLYDGSSRAIAPTTPLPSARSMTKLAADEPRLGGAERRTGVYVGVHEDSSTAPTTPLPSAVEFGKQYQVADLINAYRSLGHHAAALDPLEMTHRIYVPSLDLSYHQLYDSDMSQYFFAGKYFSPKQMSLQEIYQALRVTYCGSIGIEYMHISNNEETEWLQQKMELTRGRPIFDKHKKSDILKDLIAADGLERYLGTRYVGQKRFSVEGADSFIPLMKELMRMGGDNKVKEIVIGMAHRGRLNVLVNVLGKAPDQLFQEFEGKVNSDITGDVKYHMGFSSDLRTKDGMMHVALAFNPSHLEIIGPVVEGSARSRLERHHDLEHKNQVVPVVIHGDAAFAGQGVIMETFNFSQARGYSTGGTIHIVINNQIGFTTSNPLDARSTLYCTDVAKMVQAPIIHVNGDDPEAVVHATQIAFAFRMKFKRDVVIDLVCYRRHGHNEADDPSVTQPMMYKKIKAMPAVYEMYADTLIKEGVTTKEQVELLVKKYRDALDQGQAVVDVVHDNQGGRVASDWTPYENAKWSDEVATNISLDTLYELSNKLNTLPQDFAVHPVVQRILADRQKMTLGEIPINWGYAEIMAYASLLNEGYGVRLSGQDSGRGTFAHRHAVIHDLQTGASYVPLENTITNPNKTVAIIDSILSEEAVLAFEYGYASSEPTSLVLWEAQYGDFANGAQVVVDQFISSGEQKWGRLCGLVMLLPHGYEGQGPEHSSARLERYMQLCAQHNIQICTPTTPAQMFHMLRRQILRKFRKPLIVMSPKSLLRHKLAVSELATLVEGKFHVVLPEIDPLEAQEVTKIVLCCGKVYYDLLQQRRDAQLKHIAIVRIEQLYPFPKKELLHELKKFPQAKTVVWCQEEPQNQGVWFASQHNIKDCLSDAQSLIYAGREFAAAPAVGSSILHAKQQQKLVQRALND